MLRRSALKLVLLVSIIFVLGSWVLAEAKTVEINVWVEANNIEAYRAYNIEAAAEILNKQLEAEGSDLRVTVRSLIDDTDWGDYKRRFLFSADAGKAPDIILSGHEDVAPWAEAGFIIPLTDLIEQEWDTYGNVFPNLWKCVEWRGERWGVPQDTEARPMYYHKGKLAELGWTQEEIDSLPDRIRNGEFTLEDLIATAKEAVEKGVVKPGYGYWHRPVKGGDFMQYYLAYGGEMYDPEQDKLVVVRDALVNWYAFQRRIVTEGITPKNFIGTEWSVWHDTVTNGEVLFWNGGTWQFADWAENYVADRGGEEYLYGFVGWALQPSGIKGKSGVTLSHPLVYMVTSEAASGKKNQELAFKLITLATDPEFNNRHAVSSTHLAILKNQVNMEDYAKHRLLSGAAYMVDYASYQPNHVDYGIYFDIIFKAMQAAESGEFSPEEAADIAIEELKQRMGDSLLIR